MLNASNVVSMFDHEREPIQQPKRRGRLPRGVTSIRSYRNQIGNVRAGDEAVITASSDSNNGKRVHIIRQLDEPPTGHKDSCEDWYKCESLDGQLYYGAGQYGIAASIPSSMLRRLGSYTPKPQADTDAFPSDLREKVVRLLSEMSKEDADFWIEKVRAAANIKRAEIKQEAEEHHG